jgi:hypothetical protein
VCKSAEPPCGEKQIQYPEQKERTRSDKENEQLRRSTKEHQEQGRTNKGKNRRKKERCTTTVSLPPVAKSREEQGEQGVQEQ